MKNETSIHIEVLDNSFSASLVIISSEGRRIVLLVCEDMDMERLTVVLREWASFGHFTFSFYR